MSSDDLAGAGGGEEVVAERTCWEKYTSSPELIKEPLALEALEIQNYHVEGGTVEVKHWLSVMK